MRKPPLSEYKTMNSTSGYLREILSSRRFRRLLLGYIAVFLLPLMLLYFWIVRGVVSEKRASIEMEALEKMRLLVQSVDQQIGYAQYIAYDIGGTISLRPAQLHNSVPSLMTGIEELSKYRMNNDFWSDVYYLIEEDSIVYTTKGIMNWNVFLDRKVFASEREAALLREQVDAIHHTTAWGSDVSCVINKNIFYILSTRRPLANYHGAVICEVNRDALLDLLKVFDPATYSFFIYNNDGTQLFVRGSEQPIEIDTGRLTEISTGRTVTEFQEAGEQLSLISGQSTQNSWQFIAVVPTDILLQDALKARTTVFALLLVICLMGSMLVMMLSWRSYAPLRIMRQIALEKMPELEEMPMDELDLVRAMMDRSIEQRDELEASIERQRSQITRQTLRLLLSGFRTEDMHVMLQAMKSAHIDLNRGAMSVFLISRSDKVNPLGEEDMTALLSAFGQTPYQIYLCPRTELGALAVVASHAPGEQAYLAFLLYQEVRLITEDIIVAVSSECGELTQLASALNQAGSAMEWGRECSESGIYSYNDIPGAGDSINRLRQAYFQAVYRGDAELALLNMQNLIGHVMSSHSYEFGCIVLCELINSLSSIGQAYLGEEGQDVQEVMRFASFDELRGLLVRMTQQVSQSIHDRDVARESSRGNELKNFVEASYQDSNFSLKLLADHFGMTPNYAGRIFRAETGQGFSDYVSGLRMEYVKKALRDTDEPIKDIVWAAGYQDVPNFMRKFKQMTGVTPGEYRKMNQQQTAGRD